MYSYSSGVFFGVCFLRTHLGNAGDDGLRRLFSRGVVDDEGIPQVAEQTSVNTSCLGRDKLDSVSAALLVNVTLESQGLIRQDDHIIVRPLDCIKASLEGAYLDRIVQFREFIPQRCRPRRTDVFRRRVDLVTAPFRRTTVPSRSAARSQHHITRKREERMFLAPVQLIPLSQWEHRPPT